MPSARPVNRQGGFIALHAMLGLALMLGLVVLVLAHWDGQVLILRQDGARAQARLLAYDIISERLTADRMQVPRPWLPPLRGEAQVDGVKVVWTRRPVDGRWRAGARPWGPEWMGAWVRLGASRESLELWRAWIENRQNSRDPAWGLRGDLITDRGFLDKVFREVGLGALWERPERMWTLDEAGALARVNLLGADPQVMASLTGIPQERIQDYLRLCEPGWADAALAQQYWRFDEGQALAPFAYVQPFPEAIWEVDVTLPTFRDTVVTHWRTSTEEGAPGSPWFKIRPWNPEVW